MVLVELLAYAADNLSYRQDSIANEAYLDTARQRISIRRQARLVDYFMHEGCNARAFVHFAVVGQGVALDAGTQLLSRVPKLAAEVAPASRPLDEAITGGALVFETGHDAVLDERLNELHFYSWGELGCCLPKGTTSAWLLGDLGGVLKVGDIVIFEEVLSPTTLVPEDADLTHRWAVRLTSVVPTTDPSGQLFHEPAVDGPVDVTEIVWDAADALPFPLCLSVVENEAVLEISVARGNVVLADHGLKVTGEDLGAVPEISLTLAPARPGRLLRDARRRCRCRRGSDRRWPRRRCRTGSTSRASSPCRSAPTRPGGRRRRSWRSTRARPRRWSSIWPARSVP